MKHVYLFDKRGACVSVRTASDTERAAELAARSGADAYVVSDQLIDLRKARLVGGRLESVEPTVTADEQWHAVREKRSGLLRDSDWTDTASAPERLGPTLYQAWQAYRQALRDVTKQTDPFSIVWPNRP